MITIQHMKYAACCAAVALTAACSDEPFRDPTADARPGTVELRLQADIDQMNVTRADDNGFADGDRIGIYAVNYDSGQPGELLDEGNQATNVRFTYDEASNSWTGDRQLYFKDEKTPLDVYGYYPYNPKLSGVREFPYSVERNQNIGDEDGEMGNYQKSDLLLGAAQGVSPTVPLAVVTFRHAFAGVKVTLMKGDGFSDSEWAELEKSVLVASTRREAVVDLAAATAVAAGEYDGRDIVAAAHGSDFRAIVVPQTVAASNTLLVINAGSDSWRFTREEETPYSPGRLHSFTILVNRKQDGTGLEFSLLAESVTVWESDPESHNGEAKEYVVVDVPEFGGLEEALKNAGLNAADIENLKVTGCMNADDFRFIRENMPYLKAINMRELKVRDRGVGSDGLTYRDGAIPNDAYRDLRHLRTVVLPEGLKAVGEYAFGNTSLGGTLNLPETLEYIGNGAFGQYYGEAGLKTLTGTLRLPPSLRYIGSDAFAGLHFSGELTIPENVTYIGGNAFSGCEMITGELHIPEKTAYIGENAFAGMRGMTGKLVYPHGMKSVYNIASRSLFSAAVLPEGPEEIKAEALRGIPVRGDLVVPETVRGIGEGAFEETYLSHVALPSGIDMLPERLFKNCRFLQDTVHIPERVEIIGAEAFSGCEKLNAVIIPKRVHTIRAWAFDRCGSLSYIRCDAPEPPEITGMAFNGIDMDNFTLEVPENSVDLYRNAPGWKEFRRIAAYRNFVARPSKYNVLNNGGTKEIILNADADWEVTGIPAWCHLDKTTGSMKTVLTLTVDPMAHGSADRTGKITFRLKGDSEYLTHIDVGQYDYEYDEDSVITLQRATRGRGVNIFLVGDGYDAIDISSGTMLADMRQEAEYFFGVEPFTTYRDMFNVYVGVALSDDSGVEDINHWRNTRFHTVVSNSDTRLETDYMSALHYAFSAPGLTGVSDIGVILVANTPIYEGITYSMGDSFCAVVTLSDLPYPNDARGTVQHEAGGHGIGMLADEYVYHPEFIQRCQCMCCPHTEALRAEQSSMGYGLNLSLTGKFREVPWHHLMTHPDYDDIVDIYEGGYYHGRGVYRSEYNSCMNNNVPYFSTWSRQLIVQRIMHLAGETFSLDEFLALDKRDMGNTRSGTTRGIDTGAAALHGRRPQFMKRSEFDKYSKSRKAKGRRR